MEREGRGENFVNKKRLNIVARSVAAISVVAAGIAAVEKSGLFDPLANHVDSANHLVLNNLHESYEQLVDKLPEVENAEAQTGVDDIVVGQKTIAIIPETGATQDDIEYIRAVIVNLVNDSPVNFTTYVNESSVNSIIVRVYRNNTTVLGGKVLCQPPGGSGSNVVRIDLADNDVIADYLEVFSADDKQIIYFTKNQQTLAHEFGHLNYTDCDDPSLKENPVLIEIGAGWTRTRYGYCRLSDNKTVSDIEVGPDRHQGVLNVSRWRSDRVGAGGAWPDEVCSEDAVGGIVKQPDVEALPQDIASEKNPDYTTPIAAGVAAAITGTLTAAGAVLYIRRKRSA